MVGLREVKELPPPTPPRHAGGRRSRCGGCCFSAVAACRNQCSIMRQESIPPRKKYSSSALRAWQECRMTGRQAPNHTLEVDFCPIVQIPCTGMHHEAALEMCGNTTDAAKRNEQQADLATVRDDLSNTYSGYSQWWNIAQKPTGNCHSPTEDTFGFLR